MAAAGQPEITILLAGPSGAGKSETGCTLTGAASFATSASSSSVTQRCQAADFLLPGEASLADGFAGRLGRVVDTPGFGDSNLQPEEQLAVFPEFKDFVPDGLSALLFVVAFGRFGAEVQESMRLFFELLGGEDAKDMAILVVTNCEENPEEKEALVRASKAFERYGPSFGGGVVCIGNEAAKAAAPPQQVLFRHLRQLLQRTGGRKWSCRHLNEAREFRFSMERRITALPNDLQAPARSRLAALQRGLATREEVQGAIAAQQALHDQRVEQERQRLRREQEAREKAEQARRAELRRQALEQQRQEEEKQKQRELEAQRRLREEQVELEKQRLAAAAKAAEEKKREQERLAWAETLRRQQDEDRRMREQAEREQRWLEEERRAAERRRQEAEKANECTIL